jgi:hypothetical protein
VAYTLFVCLLVPVYTLGHGPGNFLWFSNVALLTTTVALWLESARLASMMTLAILLPELGWNLSFFARLLFGIDLLGLTGYMFDSEAPLLLRLLSLYHIPLPGLLVWLVYRLGYDPAALIWQTGLAWLILPLSYLVSTGDRNINWTRGMREEAYLWLPEPLHLLFLMLAFPILIYVPTHYLLQRWFLKPACRPEGEPVMENAGP